MWYLFCVFKFHQFLLMPLSTPIFHFLQINIIFLLRTLHYYHLFICFWPFLHLGNACLCIYIHFSVDLKNFSIYYRYQSLVCSTSLKYLFQGQVLFFFKLMVSPDEQLSLILKQVALVVFSFTDRLSESCLRKPFLLQSNVFCLKKF